MIASDQTAFLAFLAENPTDLVARAVYADWLEENDDGIEKSPYTLVVINVSNFYDKKVGERL